MENISDDFLKNRLDKTTTKRVRIQRDVYNALDGFVHSIQKRDRDEVNRQDIIASLTMTHGKFDEELEALNKMELDKLIYVIATGHYEVVETVDTVIQRHLKELSGELSTRVHDVTQNKCLLAAIETLNKLNKELKELHLI